MDERASAPPRVMTLDPDRTWSREYPGTPDQIARARAFLASVLDGCPAAEDAILLMSEIAANAVQHSHSGRQGGRFTIRADARAGDGVLVQVEDQGGPWQPVRARTDGRGHGLDIVTALADDWGRHGDPVTGWTVWFRLAWAAPAADGLAPPQVPLPVQASTQSHDHS
jgi:hypothetical protein